ncbi:hypothetical protein HZS36_21525 [Kalamiella piersonii]|jgi:hypothetical protein|nr:hypothetical protein [Pantoea piersonii]NYB09244.1 hypothetical protein [Pantoea piersonii]NYB36638.1 hypothetical protein [Pantoea piersonii]RKJ83245.1 hypothetical protein D7S44_21405 [Pantoea piersonii]
MTLRWLTVRRGLYESPESYPWKSHAEYWLVTGLYSQMKVKNLSESELLRTVLHSQCLYKVPRITGECKRLKPGHELHNPVCRAGRQDIKRLGHLRS